MGQVACVEEDSACRAENCKTFNVRCLPQQEEQKPNGYENQDGHLSDVGDEHRSKRHAWLQSQTATDDPGDESVNYVDTQFTNKSDKIIRFRRHDAFEVVLVREGPFWRKLGISLHECPETDPQSLMVDEILRESLIACWNDRSSRGVRVEAGHFIISINGVGDQTDRMLSMLQSLGRGATITLMVAPPHESGIVSARGVLDTVGGAAKRALHLNSEATNSSK